MSDSKQPEYLLTIVQHTYCADCMWVKGKITDVYHASGIVRGEDSRYWRVQILSPPWDREARKAGFPSRFETVDVPALKLEADGRLVVATQNSSLITDILVQLKWMLINRHSNAQIEQELLAYAKSWKPRQLAPAPPRSATPVVRTPRLPSLLLLATHLRIGSEPSCCHASVRQI